MSPIADDPYVGLTHFTEEYADRFFGRDTECALIIGNLRAARLTLLYAESGVGKSSLLRAGVVARLHGFAAHDVETRGSPRLVPIVFSSWSDRPVPALIRAIDDAVRPYLPPGAPLELPEDDLDQAIETASEALDATLLIVLDQFEEHFLYPDDQVEEKRVAAQVARCVNRADLRANFLISIREDAYAQLGDLFRGKVTNVYGNFLHLDFLDRAGARESIEKPIERVNELGPDGEPFELESALVAAVLDQVGREQITPAKDGQSADSKPRDEVETTYLQLVMRRLWEEETAAGSRRLRLQTLEDRGGSQAIIRSHLDRAMGGEADGVAGLNDAQRRVAASIFHFLVTSGGTKIALTARDLADLSTLPVAEIEPVLQHLSSPKLHILRPVVADEGQREPRFEIFHDALARPIVDWRTRVEEAELDARVGRERAKKEKAQQAAAEAERREASERKRKRLALALLGVAVLALLGTATYFIIDQSHLADQRKAATQSVRAVERLAELSNAPTLFGPPAAALASVEAYRLSPTDEARDVALAELQLNPGMPRIVAGHTRSVNTVAYWPGSANFASGGDDGAVRLWNARGEELVPPLVNPSEGVESLAVSEPLSRRARIVAVRLSRGDIRLWKIGDSGEVLGHWEVPGTGYPAGNGLAFDPHAPTVLAVAGSNESLMLWDLKNPGNPVKLGDEEALGPVFDLAFDPSGQRLFTASSGGGQEWRVSDSGFAGSGPVTRNSKPTWSVAAAPNGSYAFGDSRGIDLWDAIRGRQLHLRALSSVYALAFAAGGSVLVSGSEDWNVTTWDVASGRPFGPPRATEQAVVLDLAISPDGKHVAAASEDSLVKLWPLNPSGALAITVGGLSPQEYGPHLPDVRGLAISSHGLVAAAAGPLGTSIWKSRDLADTESAPQPLTRIPGRSFAVAYHDDLLVAGRKHSFVLEDTGPACRSMPAEPCPLAFQAKPHSDARVVGLAISRYGHRLLLASSGDKEGEGILNLWEITGAGDGTEIAHLAARKIKTEIISVAFSPASPLVAAATKDGKMRVWDVSDPDNPKGIVIKHAHGNEEQPVATVAFSPDGRLLASGGGDQQVALWRVGRDDSDRLTVKATPGTLFQPQSILSLAFSPDGETLAAGDGDGRTCLYRVEKRSAIGSGSCLLGHSTTWNSYGGIESLQFAHLGDDKDFLLTAGTGQPIVAWSSDLWNLSHTDRAEQKIASDICTLAGRNLTRYEWNAVFSSTNFDDDRGKTCPQYPLP